MILPGLLLIKLKVGGKAEDWNVIRKRAGLA